ncbi:polyprenyl synthetase family protein [Flavitalea sp. BT771]|uniref:polyprenyl synthetase family protein n=1 Tax=Flavitalea sp. BT771 TaxID=3063329 RepID=UPI0026E24C02|nr:polyprenyl synthetase family protein [Flavitalea sp. BT771]MDO6429679.1 polyprenyl synthetase family protein [Flavitalea sp. BT771]MDV6218193.1 polyprenyl synthetase family protein [Flavitalea sp. BT771]
MQLAQVILREELVVFERKFKEAVKSQVPLLDRIMRFIVNRKGKQLRPMFVLLSAKLCGPINESAYRAASLVELLHTATLVHDDVVDESLERRGFFSTYALWKTKVSVLVGDYLLSKGLLLSLDHSDFRILQLLSDAVRKMSEGELLQMEKSRSLNLSEAVYFEIIRNKTASLLASSCAAGAFASSQDEVLAEKMRRFGEKVGIAFQIKDDLFDYGSEAVGKPTGNDIKEKKLTLPLIYTLNNIDKATRRELIYIIKNHNKDNEKVRHVIKKVVSAGGIEYATQKMNAYRDEALAILHEFEDNDVRKGLEELVRYTTDRKY